MPRAVCLLSGGLDSTTCLAVARRDGYECYALSFDYGQRHRFELEAAARVATHFEAKRHLVVKVPLDAFGGSALTENIAVPKSRSAAEMSNGIPITYVPARNTIFLSLALAWAETLESSDIFIGVNALDYSGYPDCRPEYIEAYERMANLATKAAVEGRTCLKIHTPLMLLNKAEIVKLARDLQVPFGLTHSCYDPVPAASLAENATHACSAGRVSKRRELKIAELFYSLQGEGVLVGVPSFFIRTSGCNLRCSWCDTPYTSWKPEGENLAIDQIIEAVKSHPARHVVVTGGEPMVAPEIVELTARLHALRLHITIETAGTVFQPVTCDLMSISPKLANSTPEGDWASRHERLRIQPATLRQLLERYDYQLKFVVENPEDVDEVRELVVTLGAPPDRVILMPEGIDTARLHERALWLAEICKQEGFRFSPRLHIDLYGSRRGV